MLKRYGFVFLLALTACVGTRPATGLRVAAGYCDPPTPTRYDSAFVPLRNIEAALTPDLLARYSQRTLQTANAVGILPLLQQLVVLEKRKRQPATLTDEVALLDLRQRILAQLALVSTSIASVAAELDCEGERADQIATYLRAQDNRRTQRLNVLSISIGAASGIGTTVLDNKAAQYSLGIGGGLLAAGLGLLTLHGGHTAEFTHPRNLLTDIWTEQPTSTLFPPSVWYMLTTPAFSNSGKQSIAHNTRKRWEHYGELAQSHVQTGQQLATLLFGTGGQYTADQLVIRADMLNELQSAIYLLNQELQGLLSALNIPAP